MKNIETSVYQYMSVWWIVLKLQSSSYCSVRYEHHKRMPKIVRSNCHQIKYSLQQEKNDDKSDSN